MQIPFEIGNDTVYLCCDENNYTLARKRERTREGRITTELEAFKWFANIGNALNRLIDMKVKASDAKSLSELRQVIESARDEVNSVWSMAAERR